MRADVNVVAAQVRAHLIGAARAIGLRKALGRQRGDVADDAAPARMSHDEAPCWRHDDDRCAVGEAQQRRDARNGYRQRVGPCLRALLRGNKLGSAGRVDIDDGGSVHLVGNDDGGIRRAKRLHDAGTVLHDVIEVVLHMRPQVQRRECAFADTARAAGKRHADAARIEKRLVGEHGNATRAARARVEMRCR